ncbi:DUF4133 domain-containing protein [Solitalea lacus]|uniref:DUF4133 domain-containing protein n=1 Tax=Solitalea lacus TaxID=2911172 RepID=UPI001EDA0DF1|nr:DUF4133 domain-containing protein [Solitalea lacus]UKJ09223.1 DUF4133 domain-containing protein [Solitalea lacus]
MNNSIYQINKGINKSVEFKGLRAQYIWYLGAGLVLLLILFVILYIIGVNSFVCIGIVMLLGTLLIFNVYSLSNKYGEHGMMKALAKRSLPKVIKVQSRIFLKRTN